MATRTDRHVAGAACPVPGCGRYAAVEPDGYRCLTHGHLVGAQRGWRQRQRQRTLDLAYSHPSRAHHLMLELLERLEEGPGRPGEDGA